MLSPTLLLMVASIGLVAGFLIGSVGIGAVIILPLLIHIPSLNLTPHEAIPACMLAYIIVACAGTAAYARHQSINWRECQHVLIAATPASFAAAASLNLFSSNILELILYTLVSVTSVFSLRSLVAHATEHSRRNSKGITLPQTDDEDDVEMQERTPSFDKPFDAFDIFRSPEEMASPNVSPLDSPPSLANSLANNAATNDSLDYDYDEDIGNVTKYQMWLIGVVSGLLSPLTGTSGPVVFLPLSLALNYPILNALGAAQIIQFPISCASSITFALWDSIDVPLAAALAAGATPGVIVGGMWAHRINKIKLQILVTCFLLTSSCVMLLSFFLRWTL
jgi:uncharacterized membrane protein YfcA